MAQPPADIDRRHKPTVSRMRQRELGEHVAKSVFVDAATADRIVERTVTALMLGDHRQVDQAADRTVRT